VTEHEYTSIEPMTGEVIATYARHEAPDIEARLSAADEAWKRWRRVAIEDRAALLLRLADELDTAQEDLALLATSEMGKPLAQSRAEVAKCALACRHYAASGPEYLGVDVVSTEADRSYVRYDPIGPVLAIMPWNFPYWQVVRMLAPAILAGNVLLLKAAPSTMGTGEALVEVASRAGLPDGVVQTLRVDPAQIEGVIADDRVSAVTFTGSTGGGRAVAALAGAQGKRTVLELGGSDPFVVLEDADVGRAATAAVGSRIMNAGQSCVSAKRFIVHRAVADAFTEAMAEGIAAAIVGDPRDSTTDVGPLAREDIRQQLVDQVDRSLEAGALPVVRGGALDGPGFFYAPTLLAGVDKRHAVGSEETFGPVGAILVADDDAALLELANDTEYGLGGAVWTGDLERGERFVAGLDVGVASINDMVKSDPRLPFGGVKASGYGRELGAHGIREFVNVKSVWAMR